jgi:hypothetical protein
MASSIALPIDLADEIGQDEMGAARIEKQQLGQLLRGQDVYQFFQKYCG